MLTFFQISDTHLTAGGAPVHGADSERLLRAFVAHANALPHQPAFVLHTGDLANDRELDSYERAQAILDGLRAPLVLVNGNHDDPALLRKFFGLPFEATARAAGPLDYHFTLAGEQFLVLDANNPAVRDPLGQLSAAQLEYVRAVATPDGPPLTVCLHYPPFPMGSPWLDDNMLLVNGDDLHAALLPARDRLRAVFFGHLHRSAQIMRDGILYVSAPSLAFAYLWHSWQDAPMHDPASPPAYNVVRYHDGRVSVQQYALPL